MKDKIIVKDSDIHGKGLFVSHGGFLKGDFITKYWGPIICDEEACRLKGKPGHTMLWRLDPNRIINGNVSGNPARYMNHSCRPNTVAEVLCGEVLFYATRKILPGEEVTIDYMLTVPGRVTKALRAEYACRCGAFLCRGTMFKIP